MDPGIDERRPRVLIDLHLTSPPLKFERLRSGSATATAARLRPCSLYAIVPPAESQTDGKYAEMPNTTEQTALHGSKRFALQKLQ